MQKLKGDLFYTSLVTLHPYNQGLKWDESIDLEAFGLVYDGEGTGGDNRLSLSKLHRIIRLGR